MKNAVPLSLLCITIAATILMIGIFIGRRSAALVTEPRNPTTNSTTSKTQNNTQGTEDLPDVQDKININTAGDQELARLPGIGISLAQSIINYRNENGNFKDISEIKNVKGIGDARFNKIKDYITVG